LRASLFGVWRSLAYSVPAQEAMPGAEVDSWDVETTTGVGTLGKERRMRAVRALVWLFGAAVGAAGLLTLTLRTWGTEFPLWVGMIVIAATMLCGDTAERVWRRIAMRMGPQLT
jgi:hypothetical protein